MNSVAACSTGTARLKGSCASALGDDMKKHHKSSDDRTDANRCTHDYLPISTMTQVPLLLVMVMVCWLSGDCRRPPASMMSCRLSCSVARSPRRSIDRMVILTFCDVTARNPCWIRRSSSAPRLGLIDRNSARSFDSIARAYAATTARMAASSSGSRDGSGAGLRSAADSPAKAPA